MKLFLHIGTEKTATTSTQRWFQRNRPALLEQGIWYSKVLGPFTHRKLCLWALDAASKDEGFRNHSIFTEKEKAAFRQSLPRDFEREVSDAREKGAHTFVISNEHMHSRLKTPAEVQRVYDFLSPHFSDIQVLVFLRPQVDVAVSLTSTLSRDRWTVKPALFDQVTPENPYYNYHDLVRRWTDVFGYEDVSVLPYRKWPTAAQYLINLLKIETENTTQIPRVNEAVDVQVMAMINSLNSRRTPGGAAVDEFSRIFLNRFECTEKLSIGSKLAQEVQDRFLESNAALVAARPQELKSEDLLPDWEKYDAPPNLWKLERSAVFDRALTQLVQIFNEELLVRELRAKIAMTQRAIARKKPSNAHRHLGECLTLLAKLKRSEYPPEDYEAAEKTVNGISSRLKNLAPPAKG